MRFAVAKLVAKSFGVGFFAIGVIIVAGPVSQAQSGTVVSANVCGQSQTANIVITSPLSNTAVNTQQVTVKGTLTQVTQLTAYIDSKFSEVVPIDSNATTFSYVYLAPTGQHTLRLEGQDLCQRTTPVAEITLTYNPALPPTPITGPTLPETASPTAKEAVAEPNRPNETIGSLGGSSAVLPTMLRSIGEGLTQSLVGLGIISTSNPQQSVTMATRFALVSSGTIVVVLAGCAVKLSALLLPAAAKNGLIALAPGNLAAHPRFAISLVGLALVAVGMLLPN